MPLVTIQAPLTCPWQNSTLVAYESTENSSLKEHHVSQMKWYSFGKPEIVWNNQVHSQKTFYHVEKLPFKFVLYVKMALSEEEKKVIALQASHESGASSVGKVVDPQQIKTLICDEITGKIELEIDGVRHVLTGRVQSVLQNNPCELEFPIMDRVVLEELEKRVLDTTGISVTLFVAFNGTRVKEQSVQMTSDNSAITTLMDDVFGKGQEVLVTRNQMSEISHRLFHSLTILEEYNCLDAKEFEKEFLQHLIGMTNFQNQIQTDFTELGLLSLSKYGLNVKGDFTADTIRKSLERTFTREKRDTHDYIKVNLENQNSGTEHSSFDAEVSVGCGLTSVDASMAMEQSKSWANSDKSLNEQLNELNTLMEKKVRFEFEGEKIVPKSIALQRLQKSSLVNFVSLTYRKRKLFEGGEKLIYKLNTSDVLSQISPNEIVTKLLMKDTNHVVIYGLVEQLFQQLAKVEKELKHQLRLNVPIGAIKLFSGHVEPEGWKWCDGSVLSCSSYPDLFAVIGTTFGGDGVLNFALPDLRGRVPVGAGQGSGLTDRKLGHKGGTEAVQLFIQHMPKHAHSGNTGNESNGHTHRQHAVANFNHGGNGIRTTYTGDGQGALAYDTGVDTGGNHQPHTHTVATEGGDQAHENMQPFVNINFMIKCVK
ncbi:hypothetical protein C9374_008534 [Naegleria lovaniensis]|uniref:Phage tail collar domain-containing protein n=1 Tax=Naegleria lovaniensis TaxID=51637 RepID=A0AA88GJL5_NAELO|nr:uncharacterized protein C9374_008534 [Naegleria lovaniensis]KAG2378391.1 hypothetical protein C9374_008534 [Naegleria lovaniensis]